MRRDDADPEDSTLQKTPENPEAWKRLVRSCTRLRKLRSNGLGVLPPIEQLLGSVK